MQKYNPINYIVLILFVLIGVTLRTTFRLVYICHHIPWTDAWKDFGTEILEYHKDLTT